MVPTFASIKRMAMRSTSDVQRAAVPVRRLFAASPVSAGRPSRPVIAASHFANTPTVLPVSESHSSPITQANATTAADATSVAGPACEPIVRATSPKSTSSSAQSSCCHSRLENWVVLRSSVSAAAASEKATERLGAGAAIRPTVLAPLVRAFVWEGPEGATAWSYCTT